MQIIVINGNTKQDGFIADSLDIITAYIKKQGIDVENIQLTKLEIKDCIGCFQCLKTGKCVLDDDMSKIIKLMIEADGFVIGAPVRNGLTTACYKRFIERITYTLGFPLLLEDKHTLAISSVGIMGGKKVNKKLLGLQDVFHTRLSDYLFFAVGIPTKLKPSMIKQKLEKSADMLIKNIETHRSKSLVERITAALDRIIMYRFLLNKSPELYTHVISNWKKKHYIP